MDVAAEESKPSHRSFLKRRSPCQFKLAMLSTYVFPICGASEGKEEYSSGANWIVFAIGDIEQKRNPYPRRGSLAIENFGRIHSTPLATFWTTLAAMMTEGETSSWAWACA